MIKPCAKARLLGQTRKPNTDWKPNYGLLTRSAWLFRGNPWESVGIRGNPWESVGIRGNPWESVGIRGTREMVAL